MNTYFTFIGEFAVSGDASKPAVTTGKNKNSDNKNIRLNFMVVEDKNNRGFVEAFDSERDKIYTFGTDNQQLEIDWDDRLNADTIAKVAPTRLYSIQLPDDSYSDRSVFVTAYDFVEYVGEHLEELKGRKVVVSGVVNRNFYNGKTYTRYEVQSIRPAADDVRNELRINPVIWFRKEDIDLGDWNKEHTIYINGYTDDFIRKEILGKDKGENRFVAQQIIFHLNVDDFNDLNEAELKKVKGNLAMLGVDFDTETFKVTKVAKLKDNAVYINQIGCHLKNGADEVPFDASMLTDGQKFQIEMGLKTLEDFKPKNGIMGRSVQEWRYRDIPMQMERPFNLKDGYIVADDKYSEFEDKIFTPVPDEEKRDSELKGKMNEPEELEFPPKEGESKSKIREELFG